jgi:uncharacterized membrane protein YozB (DUF420 family)
MAIAVERTAPRARGERLFFGGMALAIAAFTFVGFARTYYLYPLFHGTTSRGVTDASFLTPLVHFHALATSAWIVLLVVQTGLIAAHRRDLHRRLGLLAIPVLIAFAVASLWAALHAARANSVPSGWTAEQFLLIQFGSLGGFLILATLGLVQRARADVHKRLMLLATIAASLPAAARVSRLLEFPPELRGVPGGMMLIAAFVVPLVLYDLWARGRLHPATLWGGGFVLALLPLRYYAARTEAWESVGRLLVG